MQELNQQAVDIIDWVVVGLAGLTFAGSCAGALYAWTWGWGCGGPSKAESPAASRHFNTLWRVRMFLQLVGILLAAVQLLRLQVLWAPKGLVSDEGWYTTALCRGYIGIHYGIVEPALLLLVLFSCVYAVQSGRTMSAVAAATAQPLTVGGYREVLQQRSSSGTAVQTSSNLTAQGNASNHRTGSTTAATGASAVAESAVSLPSGRTELSESVPAKHHPNFNIIFFALGFSLPCCAAQLVAALFTRIFDLDYGAWLFRKFFASFDDNKMCMFPLLSTLISAGFGLLLLLALWVVTARIVAASINKRLVARVRALQFWVPLSLAVSLACRGVTILFDPFQLGFELLRLGHVVASFAMYAAASYILVLRPVYEARAAAKIVQSYAPYSEGGAGPGYGSRGYGLLRSVSGGGGGGPEGLGPAAFSGGPAGQALGYSSDMGPQPGQSPRGPGMEGGYGYAGKPGSLREEGQGANEQLLGSVRGDQGRRGGGGAVDTAHTSDQAELRSPLYSNQV